MQVKNYMCPPGSYYDMTLGACIPVAPNAFEAQPTGEPIDFKGIASPNQAIAGEIAMRKGA